MERKRLAADRLIRIWWIVDFIARQPGSSRAQLAQHFALSERQLQADLNIVRDDIGLPLARCRGYRFAGDSAAASALTLGDVVTLSAVARRALADPSVPRDGLVETMAKLAGAFPPPLQPLARQALASPTQRSFGPGPEAFSCLAEAIWRRQPVKLRYPAGNGAGLPWEPIVDPQVLMPYRNSWYLIGRSHQRQQIALFCLDSLESATLDL